MSNVLDAFCRCGLTVREARDEMGRLLNKTLTVPEETDADYLDLPLSVYLERLKVGTAQGLEETPGNALGEPQGDGDISKSDLFIESLMGIRKSLEAGDGSGHSCPECR